MAPAFFALWFCKNSLIACLKAGRQDALPTEVFVCLPLCSHIDCVAKVVLFPGQAQVHHFSAVYELNRVQDGIVRDIFYSVRAVSY